MLIPISGNHALQVESVPDECPRCHRAVQPIHCFTHVKTALPARNRAAALVVFKCPRHECSELFIARYTHRGATRSEITWGNLKQFKFTLQGLEPRTLTRHAFPADVVQLSPRFARIYDQASMAEQMGLEEIAGPGYGKALEFVVKDYLIAKQPNEADAIRREFLGTVIRNRIDDARVKKWPRQSERLG